MRQTIEMVVTVKAYPSISTRYGETVCVAGVRTDTREPEWVRLYPVQYRDLDYARRFSKYQRLTLDVLEASDARPESLKPVIDTIELGGTLNTADGWAERRGLVEPLMIGSMCQLRALQASEGRSLGVFRPATVDGLTWEKVGDEWVGQKQAVVDDVLRIRNHPLVPRSIPIYGFVYDVKYGKLIEVEAATQAGVAS